jgi:hypothetical protein
MIAGSETMMATGWKNGRRDSPHVEYGLKLEASDRDRYFRREWRAVRIDLPDGSFAKANTMGEFWGKCAELRSTDLGRWMFGHGYAPWKQRQPPRFKLEHLEGNRFRVIGPIVGKG